MRHDAVRVSRLDFLAGLHQSSDFWACILINQIYLGNYPSALTSMRKMNPLDTKTLASILKSAREELESREVAGENIIQFGCLCI